MKKCQDYEKLDWNDNPSNRYQELYDNLLTISRKLARALCSSFNFISLETVVG